MRAKIIILIALMAWAIPTKAEEQAEPQAGPTEEEIGQRLFVELSADKTKAVVNEPIVLTFRFYRSLAVDDLNYQPPVTKGFIEEDLGKQVRYRKTIDGVEYEIVELRKMLFPITSGTLEISPAKLACSLLLKAPSRRRSTGSLFDEFFDDPFSDSFFFGGRYTKRPVELVSEPVTIEVEPLPLEGKPASFSDAVGSFELEVDVKPKQVSVGDPVTLSIKVVGGGNLQSIKPPKIDIDPMAFKTYEPESKTRLTERETEIRGEKIFEKVLIPNDTTVQEIPAVEFSYFDPSSKKYVTKKAGPFPLQVIPASPQQKMVTLAPMTEEGKKEVALLEKDIFYIKPAPGNFQKVGTRFFHSPLFYSFLALPFVYFMLWVWQIRRLRFLTDPILARATVAAKQALQFLKVAEKAQNPKEIYAFVEKALVTYLSSKLMMMAGAVSYEGVRERLQQKGLDEKALMELKELIETCERGRFAGRGGAGSGAELVSRAKLWIAAADKILKNRYEMEFAKKLSRLGIFILGLSFAANTAYAQHPEAAFYEANHFYSEGKFEEAAQKYSAVLQRGLESGPLYYNLGNCHAKLKQKGKAVLYYEKARLLMPRDQELNYNLRLVQSQLEDRVVPKTRPLVAEKWSRLIDRFSEKEWLFLFVAGTLLVFAAAVGWLFWLRRRKRIAVAVRVLLVLWLFSACGLFSKAYRVGSGRAIVMSPKVEARYGPSERDVAAFTLHEGTFCRLLGSTNGWVQIELLDGKVAWLPASSAEKI